jgi:hypothetical protein
VVRALGQILLFVILVVGTGAILRAIANAAFPDLGSSSQPGRSGRSGRAMRSPASRAVRTAARSTAAAAAHPTNSQIRTQARADIRRMREEARLAHWREGWQHARANGTVTETRPTLRQRLRLTPFVPPAPATASSNGQNGNPGGTNGTSQPNGTSGTAPASGTQGPAPPPKASTPPAPPASTNGGTTVAAGTSTASAEKLIEGINEIHAHAQSGNIIAKREAVKAIHEGLVRFAAMLAMLSRQMSEPGTHYGPEITEPVAKAGTHCQAGAMSASEADANLSTLINMTIGEVANSSRQAPHHNELSETGAR